MEHVVIVGAGRHACLNIYPALKSLNVIVDGVCTRDIVHAQKAIETFGLHAKAYDDLKQMLECETAKKVIVVLPGEVAGTVVETCLQYGKQVFCEKSCGMSLSQAKVLSNLGKDRLHVGFMKCYAPIYQMMKKEIERLEGACAFDAYFHVDASRFCQSD